jgi:arylsulfatase A-like enzyme
VFPGDDTLPGQEANRRPGQFGYRMFTEGETHEPFNEQRLETKLTDAQSVSWCIEQLEGKPELEGFFMVCGIHRPHTPWDVPKKYFDLYPLETVQMPTVLTNDLADVPPAGVDFANPAGVHAAIVRAGLWRDRVRAYLAAISFADAQIGRLLEAFERSKHRDNTIIVFVSDHGWHLGEKEHWAKSALWRKATRVPFIWSVPGLTKGGTQCARPVDLSCLFPTICELTGVPVPKHAEGISIKPLLANPAAEWKQPAITTHLRGNHAITTDEWRYIRYADGSEELYNDKTDPNEWTNLADKPEHAKVKQELAKFLPAANAEPVEHKENAAPKGKKKAKRAAEVK